MTNIVLNKTSALALKEDQMARLEKVLYTGRTHTTGGRDGSSRSSDGRLDIQLSSPGGRAAAPIRSNCLRQGGPPVSWVLCGSLPER